MIRQDFIFDGVKSSDMNVQIVRVNSGLIETPFLAGREIIEDQPNRKSVPFHYRSKLNPLSFKLTFSLIDNLWDNQQLYDIANWLWQSDYKEFISADNLDRRYYVIGTSQCPFFTNGIGEGYFEVEYRNRYPYALSPTYITDYDLSTNPTTTTIVMENLSNINLPYYYPEIEITLTGSATGFTLKNLSDGGRETIFTGLSASEIIYMNNEKKLIMSSTNTNRFSLFNDNFFRLVKGQNYIQVTGTCTIQTRMTYPIFN